MQEQRKPLPARVQALEAENKELRKLWSETESTLIRFLALPWYKRLFVKPKDLRNEK